jgi:NAD(P)-dependent dehydrogenase (short-subunit alcohol dehydrogenase family)
MSVPFQTAVVTGTSRGFGRAIATALTAEGTRVVGVARSPQEADFTTVTADATDEAVTEDLVREHRPPASPRSTTPVSCRCSRSVPCRGEHDGLVGHGELTARGVDRGADAGLEFRELLRR